MNNQKLVLAIVAAVTVLVVGCDKLVGGGWIPGLYGGKANFGVIIQCEDTEFGPVAVGNFQYNDHSAGVRFHGLFDLYTTAMSNEYETCAEAKETAQEYGYGYSIHATGECKTQPNKRSGRFYIQYDSFEHRDWPPEFHHRLRVVTDGCGEIGGGQYVNVGFVQGGNINMIQDSNF
jgi:hypothetical protein